MLIGVDFDNTIVCYDALFHKIAREQNLIPSDLPVNKSDVRNHLRRVGQEDVWTEMQGLVYGARITEAAPYPGVIDFFRACREAKVNVCIISHKTRHPFLGEKHDLHEAAYRWLERNGFFDEQVIGLKRENVFLELTRAEKLQRIAQCSCTHFIDDLPEFLSDPIFPVDVKKLLFDPNHLYGAEKITRVQSWNAAQGLLLPGSNAKPAPEARDDGFRVKVWPFLKSHGFDFDLKLQPVSGGGNNRVYRILRDGRAFALKEYFQNPADARDRFGAEKALYDLLAAQRNNQTPEPLAWDTANKLGLFTFVDGRKLSPAEINSAFVRQAVDFVLELNRARNSEAARSISVASEACFSVAGHLSTIERRVDRLRKIETASEIDHNAVRFVAAELDPAWRKIREAITQSVGDELNRTLGHNEKWLSPSDFGFHNALLPADGRLRFFDFEYAGWDDPAKLVCDFFCQPQIPVGLPFWNQFVEALSASEKGESGLVRRAKVLLPAYQVKWCCIMLNEFVREDRARRDFARRLPAAADRKALQLEKARQSLRLLAEARR